MAKVSGSILAADFANLGRDIESMQQNGCDWVHVDVMDGMFVPNLSLGLPELQSIRAVTDMTLDVHLMVEKPIRYVERFVNAGADWLTIHIESDTEENTLEALRKIRALGCKTGISLKPRTPAQAAEPFLALCDLILVMTVEPGFGGQKFNEDMLQKLAELRRRLDEVNPECMLSVDGGINEITGRRCRESGAEVQVTGSSFFRAQDRAAFVRCLQG